MKLLNGTDGAVVAITEEEFGKLFHEIARMPHHKYNVIHGIVIIDWDIFESMLKYLSVAELDDFYKAHGGDGKSITEHWMWGNKIPTESKAKDIIIDVIFIQNEECL